MNRKRSGKLEKVIRILTIFLKDLFHPFTSYLKFFSFLSFYSIEGKIVIDEKPLSWMQLMQINLTKRLKYGYYEMKRNDNIKLHRQKVAIVIPYRNRENNLRVSLRYLHFLLQKQNVVDYGIYVVEQKNNGSFNR